MKNSAACEILNKHVANEFTEENTQFYEMVSRWKEDLKLQSIEVRGGAGAKRTAKAP
jgi:hypothetical protein